MSEMKPGWSNSSAAGASVATSVHMESTSVEVDEEPTKGSEEAPYTEADAAAHNGDETPAPAKKAAAKKTAAKKAS